MIYQLYKTTADQDAVMYVNEQGQMVSFILGAGNPEEQAYLKWLAEGNQPLPAENA